MSDESQVDASDAPKLNSGGAADRSPPAAVFNFGKVLKILIPAVIILAGSFVFFGFMDGVSWLTNLTRPPIISVTGKVLFNGEPLPQAEISTLPVNPGLRGANGASDKEGRFSLMTDVNGDFVDGAYAGTHRVTVIRRHDVVTFGPAPVMTPQQYASFDTSPLQITIAKGQPVELRLEGKTSDPPRAMPPMTQQQPPPTKTEPPPP